MRQDNLVQSSGAWIALLVCITALGPGSLNILLPGLPDAARELSVSYADIQWAVSLYMIAIAAALPILGPLADRFGRRRVLLAGLALSVLGSLVSALAPNLALLILGRMVQAVGNGACVMIPRVLVRDTLRGSEGARAMAITVAALALAPALSPALGGFLTARDSWRATMGVTAVLGSIMLLWVWRSCAETLSGRPGAMVTPIGLWRQYGRLFGIRNFFAHCAIFAGTSAGFYTMLAFAPKRCIVDLGLAPDAYGLVVFLGAGGFFCGSLVSMNTVRRLGFARLIVIGAWVSAIGISMLALLSEWASPAAVLLPMLVYSVGNGLVYPNAMYGALQVEAGMAGSASAIVGSSQFVLSAVAIAALGSLAESGLSASAIVFVCACFVWTGVFATRPLRRLLDTSVQVGNVAR